MVVYWVVQVGDGSAQIAGILHRGSGEDGCRGPMTVGGLRPELRPGRASISAPP